MNVMFSLTNLELGGAQVFVTRLANEMAAGGHKVFIYDHWPEHRNQGLFSTLSPEVTVVSYSNSNFFMWLAWKINAALKALRINSEWRHTINKRNFLRCVQQNNIEVINSHMSFSDFVVTSAALPGSCKVVLSLHGEYEMLMQGTEDREANIQRIINALNKAAAVIYTADKNLAPFSLPGVSQLAPKTKIKVGFSEKGFILKNITREKIGLSKSDFVAGMVSRGIPDKGWDTCISAVKLYNAKNSANIKLLLIGEGKYLKNLVRESNDKNIVLLQFGDNFQDYFSYYPLMDLFVFPTRFKGESVPNVVIESLYWKVPVLSTAFAEIPSMLLCNTQAPAGVCVSPSENHDVFVSEFCNELDKLVSNRNYLSALSKNCEQAFAPFSMKGVMAQYLNIFQNAS